MTGEWFPTQLVGIATLTFFSGFILGAVFSMCRNIFFSGNGD